MLGCDGLVYMYNMGALIRHASPSSTLILSSQIRARTLSLRKQPTLDLVLAIKPGPILCTTILQIRLPRRAPDQIHLVRKGRLAPRRPQAWIHAAVGGEGDKGADDAAGRHVPHVVPVVLYARNGNEQGAEDGQQGEEGGGKRGAGAEGVQLGGEEERDEAEAGECEGGVAGGEGAPAVLECVVIRFCTDFVGHEDVLGSVGWL